MYDSRARERWRQIEEQKALALQLQSQVTAPAARNAEPRSEPGAGKWRKSTLPRVSCWRPGRDDRPRPCPVLERLSPER